MKPLKKKYEDENDLIDEFCSRSECRSCMGTDMNGEPNGYGCDGLEVFLEKYRERIIF